MMVRGYDPVGLSKLLGSVNELLNTCLVGGLEDDRMAVCCVDDDGYGVSTYAPLFAAVSKNSLAKLRADLM